MHARFLCPLHAFTLLFSGLSRSSFRLRIFHPLPHFLMMTEASFLEQARRLVKKHGLTGENNDAPLKNLMSIFAVTKEHTSVDLHWGTPEQTRQSFKNLLLMIESALASETAILEGLRGVKA